MTTRYYVTYPDGVPAIYGFDVAQDRGAFLVPVPGSWQHFAGPDIDLPKQVQAEMTVASLGHAVRKASVYLVTGRQETAIRAERLAQVAEELEGLT